MIGWVYKLYFLIMLTPFIWKQLILLHMLENWLHTIGIKCTKLMLLYSFRHLGAMSCAACPEVNNRQMFSNSFLEPLLTTVAKNQWCDFLSFPNKKHMKVVSKIMFAYFKKMPKKTFPGFFQKGLRENPVLGRKSCPDPQMQNVLNKAQTITSAL